ncbi:MAG: lysophospholipid acyltransferase family protein [Elusimicrobiota bacterium]
MPAVHERPTLPLLHRFCQAAGIFLSRFIWGLKISGEDHIPESGPLLIAANHASWIDPPLLFFALWPKRPVSFLGKAELFQKKFPAWFLRSCGVIPLDRRGDVAAMRGALDVVRSGGCVGLFPQGTRVRPGRPIKIKPGIGFLAALSGARVVPARMVKTDRFPFGRPLEIRFGPGLEFSGNPHDRDECLAFSMRVMEKIFQL